MRRRKADDVEFPPKDGRLQLRSVHLVLVTVLTVLTKLKNALISLECELGDNERNAMYFWKENHFHIYSLT